VPKTGILHYIFVAETVGIASVSLTLLALKATVLDEMMQNTGHCEVQG